MSWEDELQKKDKYKNLQDAINTALNIQPPETSWKHILKGVDYNDLDDNSKMRIAYALTGDEVYFELTDLYGDFPLYSVESTDDLPKGMGFPKHFKLYSEGDMEISEEEGATLASMLKTLMTKKNHTIWVILGKNKKLQI